MLCNSIFFLYLYTTSTRLPPCLGIRSIRIIDSRYDFNTETEGGILGHITGYGPTLPEENTSSDRNGVSTGFLETENWFEPVDGDPDGLVFKLYLINLFFCLEHMKRSIIRLFEWTKHSVPTEEHTVRVDELFVNKNLGLRVGDAATGLKSMKCCRNRPRNSDGSGFTLLPCENWPGNRKLDSYTRSAEEALISSFNAAQYQAISLVLVAKALWNRSSIS
ncbi:hypothetical protein AVEN_155105-1 [Araneus ventricosus]|uniref:Uncharacterized protein n=1 Tax=Araneus ventricosus TaxID=182803 RepID=A0A4Y2A801_ARAVE|nr:hypothetical protein AVEN_155105-1 [Araneus ventricosus]